MTYLLLGFGLVLLLYVALNAYANASPQSLLRAIKWVVAGFAALVALFLIATGRFGLLWVVLMGALPWISRIGNLASIWRNLKGPSAGQSSTVRTAMLAMSLDHDSGRMDGVVLTGPYKDRRLADMPLPELQDLLNQAVIDDPKSVELLEAYLDREYPGQWRGFESQNAGGSDNTSGAGTSNRRGGPMDRAEALALLGLDEGATEEEIRSAHRRMMKTAHPDAGGSDYLAARINEAKDVLLGA